MNYFKKIFASSDKDKTKTLLTEAQLHAGKIIILGFRRIASQHNLAPSSKTSDEMIIEIYQKVGTAFREVSEKRCEILPAGYLNRIVFKFYQLYENYDQTFFDAHLQYEVSKYLEEGLRDDYKHELNLF